MNLPAGLLLALCTVESNMQNAINFHDGRSPSYGVCQVKMATAREHGLRYASDLLHPDRNAEIAARILRSHYDRFGNWDQAIMAYNAGPYRLPLRNKKYLRKVHAQWNQLKLVSQAQ